MRKCFFFFCLRNLPLIVRNSNTHRMFTDDVDIFFCFVCKKNEGECHPIIRFVLFFSFLSVFFSFFFWKNKFDHNHHHHHHHDKNDDNVVESFVVVAVWLISGGFSFSFRKKNLLITSCVLMCSQQHIVAEWKKNQVRSKNISLITNLIFFFFSKPKKNY